VLAYPNELISIVRGVSWTCYYHHAMDGSRTKVRIFCEIIENVIGCFPS